MGRVTLNDGRRATIYGDSERDVLKQLRRLKADDDSGQTVVVASQRLHDYLGGPSKSDSWLAKIRRERRAKTYADYLYYSQKYILPELGRHKLAELKPKIIRDWLQRKLDDGYSASTVAHMHRVLRSALSDACADLDLVENYAKRVTPPTKATPGTKGARDKPDVPARRQIVPLEPEEAKRLLMALEGHPLRPVFAVAIALEMRPAEYIGLQWRSVDLSNRRLMVTQTIQRVRDNPDAPRGQRSRIVVDTTKTDAGCRVIDLPDALAAALAEHRARQNESSQGRPVGRPGSRLRERCRNTSRTSADRQGVKEALGRAGLPTAVRLYDCRHTAASLLYAQGVPELQIAAILGHTDPGFTLRTYTHLFKQSRRDAADKMGAALLGAL
jgi:integrase